MRHNLNRGTKVFATTLFVDNRFIDPPHGQIRGLCCRFVKKALVVTKIKISFSSIIGYIDLTMLVGRHGAGINIDIGIIFLYGHPQSTGLEQHPERGRQNSLTERGYYPSGHKNMFHIFRSSHDSVNR